MLGCFPPKLLDFDAANVPVRIAGALEEAIACHAAGCHRAAAIMIRRTLEELCQDRGAAGRDLKARLADLGTKVVLPKELLDAADQLRLLGNDAAHIEAKVYDDIADEEIRAGVDLARELLKADATRRPYAVSATAFAPPACPLVVREDGEIEGHRIWLSFVKSTVELLCSRGSGPFH